MTLADLFTAIRRSALIITLTTILGLATGVGAYLLITPTYTATATAYVRVESPSADPANSNSSLAASQLALQKVKTFVPVFSSVSVADRVVSELELPMSGSELAKAVSVSNDINTLTVQVSASLKDAVLARQVADEIVDQTGTEVARLEGENSGIRIVLMSSADQAEVVKSPSPVKAIGAMFALGLLAGVAIAVLRATFDQRIRAASDLERAVDVPTLGLVPRVGQLTGEDSDLEGTPFGESIRKIRTSLRYVNVDGESRVFLLTSPNQGEGKSTIARSLAQVVAMSGMDVILVDADLRRRMSSKHYGLNGVPGLAEVLAGTAQLSEVLVSLSTPGLVFLPAGDVPPNPSELLGSLRMGELLDALKREYVVLIDAAPVLPVTDTVELAGAADTVVVVAAAGSTTVDQLSETMDQLGRTNDQVAGVVLNKVKPRELEQKRYGSYGYGYGEEERKQSARHGSRHIIGRAPRADARAGASETRMGRRYGADIKWKDPLEFLNEMQTREDTTVPPPPAPQA